MRDGERERERERGEGRRWREREREGEREEEGGRRKRERERETEREREKGKEREREEEPVVQGQYMVIGTLALLFLIFRDLQFSNAMVGKQDSSPRGTMSYGMQGILAGGRMYGRKYSLY